MKICGFTFVRNAVKYGYPLAESVNSLLPLVDEMVILSGDSEDGTNELIRSIHSPKIRCVESVWDNNLRRGGEVLAEETNKAMDLASPDADWLFYLQADEVLHEKHYQLIKDALLKYKDDPGVEGILFHYHHFYGSYRFIADGRKWYSKEIRVIRNDRNIRSYRDAQGFRKQGRKLNVKLVDAYIYHYGWVRNPLVMHKKVKDFGKLWNDDEAHDNWANELEKRTDQFDYSVIDSVSLFEGTHPAVMDGKVKLENWNFNVDVDRKNFKNLKHKFLYYLWKKTGWRPFEYRNYRIV